ncbi:RNA methyltransferase [Maricaulis maris]|uniref:tRNA/rRNA methyltransferase n=1 Tax=Maricaulis maris TaxID=74318 RepID=A0A495D1B9_9PROT|nr:RNA methyltransferase [Maricaulis maris]RKQ95335.1 tRNA/rRNA methyltransferase [Maricaulis maris]
MPYTPAFILHTPQLGENIGAAARVMGNFGLPELVIVDPRDGWPNDKAVTMSAGSPVLGNARVEYRLGDAIHDRTRLYATTARPRGMEKPVMTAREAVSDMKAAIEAGETVGVMFGGEKSGLPNEAVNLADVIITLPVDRSFSSLNLAQAVAVIAYEWTAGEGAPAEFEPVSDVATRQDLERMFEHFEYELDRAGFFHPPSKTPLMVQNLRNAFIRGRWTEQEVRTFRGAVKALALGRGKARVVRED